MLDLVTGKSLKNSIGDLILDRKSPPSLVIINASSTVFGGDLPFPIINQFLCSPTANPLCCLILVEPGLDVDQFDESLQTHMSNRIWFFQRCFITMICCFIDLDFIIWL
jgi:hypothetical protein